jgi:hypothetical protein
LKRRHGPKTRAWRLARNQRLTHDMYPNKAPKSRKKDLKKKMDTSLKKSEPIKKDIFADILKRLIKF